MDAQKLLDNFSTHLKNTIARSISLAARLKKPEVELPHLLYALTEETGSIGGELLKKFSITPELISAHLEKTFQEAEVTAPDHVSIPVPNLSTASRSALEKALLRAHEEGHSYIGTEHLLFGILSLKNSEIQGLFSTLSVNVGELKSQLDISFHNAEKFTQMGEVMEIFEEIQGTPLESANEPDEEETEEPAPENSKPDTMPASLTRDRKQTSAVALFTTNLTHRQHTEKIDPVIGRDDEIERMINILSRRNKNNPILVGEPGVGKTAIVEGLAKRIAEGDIPDILKRKKILSLDLTLLVAGTIYRGEFEARLKSIIDECAKNPNYILFIDELHNIIGAGSNQGTMDAANILKPALARGQLRCIGATTYDEYKKYISSDPALERRFQKIDVDEPSRDAVLTILTGLRKHYEQYHHVEIQDEALAEAVRLSNRYIHDNFQPDKAIDLIDEASSSVKTKQKTPTPIAKFETLEKKLEEYIEKKNQAIADERLKDAAKIKDAITALEKKLQSAKKAAEKTSKKKLVNLPSVTHEHVRDVLSKKMHIDRSMLNQNEWEQLKTLKEKLKVHIMGQDEVLEEVVETLKMAELGIRDSKKPYASFLFTGPSGVGKTELAKQLAEALYHDSKAFIRLDMGEFSEGNSTAKLLGSPAGYIGYKDRNPFLEKLKLRPYSVLLFDEIDKAHPDVMKLLLQILDEGEISDTNGKKVKLAHSIIILTSNIGAELYKSQGIGFGDTHKSSTESRHTLEKAIMGKLKEGFSSALMSRINAVCIFNQLTEADVRNIILKHIAKLSNSLNESQQITIATDTDALEALARETRDKDLGARNIERKLERIIEQLVIDVISKKKKKAYTLTRKKDQYLLS
ncbi:MAG TPA: ATP-dependent Clp protease ATP-binding subunit [Candidatus Magasanikbacteria bacterium]|nr:ATP-dependent Clp protease ATP-binding subunit [Candidatus Magasanikbacteria bacterium]